MEVAGVIFDDDGRILVLRKRGGARFTLPGGKLEEGETAVEAVIREVGEELGLKLDPTQLSLLGSVQGMAANEADTAIRSTVFVCTDVVPTGIHAEIDEARWIDADIDPASHEAQNVSKLLTTEILPLYNGAGLRNIQPSR